MTSDEHVRASDRCAEAVSKLEAKLGLTYDIVVMVQGDEPMTHPGMIEEALQPMIDDPAVRIVNLLGEINSREEFMDRNCIKVVCNLRSEAMYFSREPIPTLSKVTDPPTGKQVCIIPFRRDFLTEYTVMEQTPLEIAEAIDMMRVLENGGSVRMVPTKYRTQSVDTESDLVFVEQLMSKAEFE
jgi:3-deoxy-manno-octulosonate cytidylyltransferase (CMP-KDO synthetase)